MRAYFSRFWHFKNVEKRLYFYAARDEENLFLKKDYSPLLYIDVNSVILLDQL